MVKEVEFTSVAVGAYQNARGQSDVAELKKSIQENGLLEPLVVVQEKKNGKVMYDLVAGFRRYEALESLGMKKVAVNIVGKEKAAQINLVENLHREDLTPAEVVVGVVRLKDEVGMSQKDIAEAVGKTQAWVSQRMKLSKLIGTSMWDTFVSGELPVDMALDLAGMDATKAEETASELLDMDGDTAGEEPESDASGQDTGPVKRAKVTKTSAPKTQKRAMVASAAGKAKFAVPAKAVQDLLEHAESGQMQCPSAPYETAVVDMCNWLLGKADMPVDMPATE